MLPEVITDTIVLLNPSRFVVTEEIDLIGIISVPESPFFTPVASIDRPAVNTPAVSFPADTPRGFSHSTRLLKMRTTAFFPLV